VEKWTDKVYVQKKQNKTCGLTLNQSALKESQELEITSMRINHAG
jgi:hypothetical protein